MGEEGEEEWKKAEGRRRVKLKFFVGGKVSLAKGERRALASVRPRDERARIVLRRKSAGRPEQGEPLRVRSGAVQGRRGLEELEGDW